MPAGLEVALEVALAEMLGEDLDDTPVRREAAVGLVGPGVRTPGHLEHRPELVRFELVRAEIRKLRSSSVALHHLSQIGADLVERPGVGRAGPVDRDGHDRRVGQVHRPPHPPADRVVEHAESQVALRHELPDVRGGAAVDLEQFLGLVRAQPRLDDREVGRVRLEVARGHLVGAERALDLLAVDFLRPGPALRRPEHDHRPGRFQLRGCPSGPRPGSGRSAPRPRRVLRPSGRRRRRRHPRRAAGSSRSRGTA